MNATHPAAWPTLALHELRNCPLDMIFSGLRFFGSDRPANPLIACQWREVLPPF